MCKLLRIWLLCLLLLFTFCISYSFANSVDYSKWASYDYNGNILDFYKAVFKYTTGYDYDSSDWVPNGTNPTNYLNTIMSGLANDTYQYIGIYISDGNNNAYNGKTFEIVFYKSPGSNGEYYRASAIYGMKGSNLGKVNVSQATPSTSNIVISGNLTGIQIQRYLINKNNSNIRSNQLWYKSINNNESLVSTLVYNSYKTGLISVNMPTGTYNMIKADYNLNGMINIGYLESYSNYDEIQGYLAVYSGQSNQDNSYYWYTCGTYLYNKSNNTSYNNGVRLDYSTGQVYINSNLLQYNHAYSLYFTGNGSVTTDIKYYYFVPLGSFATSGDINNDNPYGLDFDFINSIEYITNNPSGNIDYIGQNDIFSGNVLSGDIFGGFGYNKPTDSGNTYYGYIHNLFNGVIDTLLSNDDNVTLNISIHGFNKTLQSSDFVTPNSAIKSFVALFLVAGTIILLFQQIAAAYIALVTLDIHTLFKASEVDFTFFM